MSENRSAIELSDTPVATPPLNIVLYEPEIAANTGAIGRTCVGLGAKLWLVQPLGFQISNAKLKRAGLDYWPHLNWQMVNDWEDCVRHLEQTYQKSREGLNFYYFTKTAKRDYDAVSFQLGDILVFGAESRGLPPRMLNDAQRAVRIPIRDKIRSLNLSVSVAIAAFEARRQLRF
ncbi:MAG: tRNA (cytidine(34)-2'-O)-methyltransferase [Planctomycetia bacterium]|nr:tRNA (cytidine(34)-2'-O)-methyltransferase [Planctomycetia bacterium]